MNKSAHKYSRPFYSFIDKQDKNTCKDTFYNIENFTWVVELKKNYAAIKSEITNYLDKNTKELKPYFAKEMMSKPGKWQVLSFYFWGRKMSSNAIKNCPETMRILNTIPGLVSASISITEPYSDIKPHYGDTDAIYRCHLGIEIPSGLPYCGFRVGYEDRDWQEGELLIFNDAAYHRGWNYTKNRRVILLFDVIKPEHIHKKKWICAMVLGSLLFLWVNEKLKLTKKLNAKYLKPIYYLLGYIYYFINSLFSRHGQQ